MTGTDDTRRVTREPAELVLDSEYEHGYGVIERPVLELILREIDAHLLATLPLARALRHTYVAEGAIDQLIERIAAATSFNAEIEATYKL